MHTISSKLTFFYKFVLLFIWLVGFGIGSREVLFQPQFDAKWIQYAVCWAVIALFIFLATGQIKKVSLSWTKKQLEVTNFLKTENIDFSEIDDIDGSSLLSPKLVWFTLQNKSIFGRRISFIPENRPTRGIGKHPLVMQLRKEFKLDH